MILALRDRNGDLFGIAGGGPDFNDSQNYTAIAQGDLLRACANAAGGWTLEDNGSCGGVTTAGRNNNQGPGGGEYYYQDHQAQPLTRRDLLGQRRPASRPRRRGGDRLRPDRGQQRYRRRRDQMVHELHGGRRPQLPRLRRHG